LISLTSTTLNPSPSPTRRSSDLAIPSCTSASSSIFSRWRTSAASSAPSRASCSGGRRRRPTAAAGAWVTRATVAQARVVSAQSTSHRSFMRGSCLSEAEDVLPQAEGVAAVERCGHAGRKADEGAVAARKVLEQGVVAVPVEGAVAAGDETILGEEELAQASADADRR